MFEKTSAVTSPEWEQPKEEDILVSERYDSVKNAKARPSADCGSDHNPVVITLKVILKNIKRKSREKRWNKEILKNEETKLLLSAALERKLGKEEKQKDEAKQSESETIRTKMRTCITEIANKICGKEASVKNNHGLQWQL